MSFLPIQPPPIPSVLQVAPRCVNCNKAVDVIRKCAGCLQAIYCDKDCQKRHWKATHKKECGLKVTSISPKVSLSKGNKKPCSFCEKTVEKIKKCVGCSTCYCSSACRQKDWPKHKEVCLEARKNLKTLEPAKKAYQKAMKKGHRAFNHLVREIITAPDDDKRLQVLEAGHAKFIELAVQESSKVRQKTLRQVSQVCSDYDRGINKETFDKLEQQKQNSGVD